MVAQIVGVDHLSESACTGALSSKGRAHWKRRTGALSEAPTCQPEKTVSRP